MMMMIIIITVTIIIIIIIIIIIVIIIIITTIIIIIIIIIINNFIKIFLKKPVYKSSHILLSSTKILLQIKIITRTFEYLYNCYNQSFKF